MFGIPEDHIGGSIKSVNEAHAKVLDSLPYVPSHIDMNMGAPAWCHPRGWQRYAVAVFVGMKWCGISIEACNTEDMYLLKLHAGPIKWASVVSSKLLFLMVNSMAMMHMQVCSDYTCIFRGHRTFIPHEMYGLFFEQCVPLFKENATTIQEFGLALQAALKPELDAMIPFDPSKAPVKETLH